MNTFIEQLRIAHAVLSAYNRGDRSIPQIAHRTGYSVAICSEWSRAMRLELEFTSKIPKKPRNFNGRDIAHLRFDI